MATSQHNLIWPLAALSPDMSVGSRRKCFDEIKNKIKYQLAHLNACLTSHNVNLPTSMWFKWSMYLTQNKMEI